MPKMSAAPQIKSYLDSAYSSNERDLFYYDLDFDFPVEKPIPRVFKNKIKSIINWCVFFTPLLTLSHITNSIPNVSHLLLLITTHTHDTDGGLFNAVAETLSIRDVSPLSLSSSSLTSHICLVLPLDNRQRVSRKFAAIPH